MVADHKGPDRSWLQIFLFHPFGDLPRQLPFPACLLAVTSWGSDAKAPAFARWHCSQQSTCASPTDLLVLHRCLGSRFLPAHPHWSVPPSWDHWLVGSGPISVLLPRQSVFFHASLDVEVINLGTICESALILTPTSRWS